MATAVRYRVSYHEPEKDKFGLINVEPILGLFMEGDLGNYFGDQVSRLIPFSHTKGKPYFDTFEELCKCENLKIAEGYGSYAQKELDLYYDVGKNRKGRAGH